MPPSADSSPSPWHSLAALIDRLPPEERLHYQRQVGMLVHDLRHSIAVIFSAEALLRRKPDLTSDDLELLDAIHTASQRTIFSLTDFAQAFDRQVTLPLERPAAPPQPPPSGEDLDAAG